MYLAVQRKNCLLPAIQACGLKVDDTRQPVLNFHDDSLHAIDPMFELVVPSKNPALAAIYAENGKRHGSPPAEAGLWQHRDGKSFVVGWGGGGAMNSIEECIGFAGAQLLSCYAISAVSELHKEIAQAGLSGKIDITTCLHKDTTDTYFTVTRNDAPAQQVLRLSVSRRGELTALLSEHSPPDWRYELIDRLTCEPALTSSRIKVGLIPQDELALANKS